MVTYRQTDTQNDYCNPTAHAQRVNYMYDQNSFETHTHTPSAIEEDNLPSKDNREWTKLMCPLFGGSTLIIFSEVECIVKSMLF